MLGGVGMEVLIPADHQEYLSSQVVEVVDLLGGGGGGGAPTDTGRGGWCWFW